MNRLNDLIKFPIDCRSDKPRSTGLSMLIDKGLGLTDFMDLIKIAGDYIDMIKLGFGTSLLYPDAVLHQKISSARKADIQIFPGGTFFEITYLQNKTDALYELLLDYGFTGIEISDGTIELPASKRVAEIKKAKKTGLDVITEIGKKDPRDMVEMSVFREQIKADLEAGATKVIVEGRESGKGVMLYDQQGEIKEDELEFLIKNQINIDLIIWEAPLKSQQHKLISLFGTNVNLGNIAPQEILALESLRLGLRGDTLRNLLIKIKSPHDSSLHLLPKTEALK